jgi:hypothetical protein
VPKLLSDDQKEEQVRMSRDFMAAISRRSKAMLDTIIMMTELKVGNHKLVTKKQSSSAGEGQASSHYGRNPCQPDKTDALHLL